MQDAIAKLAGIIPTDADCSRGPEIFALRWVRIVLGLGGTDIGNNIRGRLRVERELAAALKFRCRQ